MSHSDSTVRFGDRVGDYVKYRPDYPPGLLPTLLERTGLRKGCIAADVGSGTGISSAMLLRAGMNVIAVEPNEPMRMAAEKMLGAQPGYRSVAGSAEETGLPDASVDLVVAAQAFHWFDHARCRVEFARILRSPKWVALVWNDRQVGGSAFLDGYENVLKSLGTDYEKVNHRNITVQRKAIETFFGGVYEAEEWSNHQDFDEAGLLGRAFSSSYTPKVDDPRRKPMEEALRELFAQTQESGSVRMTYKTQLFLGRLGGL